MKAQHGVLPQPDSRLPAGAGDRFLRRDELHQAAPGGRSRGLRPGAVGGSAATWSTPCASAACWATATISPAACSPIPTARSNGARTNCSRKIMTRDEALTSADNWLASEIGDEPMFKRLAPYLEVVKCQTGDLLIQQGEMRRLPLPALCRPRHGAARAPRRARNCACAAWWDTPLWGKWACTAPCRAAPRCAPISPPLLIDLTAGSHGPDGKGRSRAGLRLP